MADTNCMPLGTSLPSRSSIWGRNDALVVETGRLLAVRNRNMAYSSSFFARVLVSLLSWSASPALGRGQLGPRAALPSSAPFRADVRHAGRNYFSGGRAGWLVGGSGALVPEGGERAGVRQPKATFCRIRLRVRASWWTPVSGGLIP